MADFSNYELSSMHASGAYELSDGLIPEMAEATGFPLSEVPNDDELRSFIGHIGPAKTLQDNIERAQSLLGSQSDATTIAADWVDRSGVLKSVDRTFRDNTPAPARVGSAIISGGVARWMLRRRNAAESIDPEMVGTLYVPVGNRPMGEGEHQLVKNFMRQHDGRVPTEAEFANAFVAGGLSLIGFNVKVFPVDDGNGDRVLDAFLNEYPEVLASDVRVIGNAPSVVQSAAQFREAAQRVDDSFDTIGAQLYMVGDTIPVARNGEGAATHQNPITALGQIARNAAFLNRAAGNR